MFELVKKSVVHKLGHSYCLKERRLEELIEDLQHGSFFVLGVAHYKMVLCLVFIFIIRERTIFKY